MQITPVYRHTNLIAETTQVQRKERITSQPISFNALAEKPASAEASADVKISQVAKDLAAGTRGGASLRWQRDVINNAKEDAAFAEKMTKDYAYDDSYMTTGPLVDISGYPTIRYTYTGEVMTDGNLAEFKTEAAKARTDRISLYESEKAKGTSDVNILEKLFRYTDTRSDSYLNIVGWERANATESA